MGPMLTENCPGEIEKIVSLVVERTWQGACGCRFIASVCGHPWVENANEIGRKKKEFTLENTTYIHTYV